MLHYPLIKVSGATYYEIGKDYGRQAKEMIAHSINDYKQVFALSSDRSWEEMQETAVMRSRSFLRKMSAPLVQCSQRLQKMEKCI